MAGRDRFSIKLCALIVTGAHVSNGASFAQTCPHREITAPASARPNSASTERVALNATQRSLDRISKLDQRYRAFLTVDATGALRQAQDADDSSRSESDQVLRGLTIAIKDNIDSRNIPTTAGAQQLEQRRPTRDAYVVERIRRQGAVVVGKTNMDTWARGVRSLSEIGGQTRNAWNINYSAGGSSGGSAVAVATGMADVAIGTDTCGSLRYPAAFNGIYALRPTPGLVSRDGVIPLSPTHDVVGPMARTPQDLARLFDVMVGADERDPLTALLRGSTSSQADAAALPMRVGVVNNMGSYQRDATKRSAVDYLRAAGIELVDVPLPPLQLPNVIEDEFPSAKQLFLKSISSPTDINPWLFAPQGMGRSYRRKLDARSSDRSRIEALLRRKKLGALIYPTINATPSRIGEVQPSGNCAVSSNTGLPALALPGGLGADGLPTIGVDVLSVQYSESFLLEIARRYSQQRKALPIAGGPL